MERRKNRDSSSYWLFLLAVLLLLAAAVLLLPVRREYYKEQEKLNDLKGELSEKRALSAQLEREVGELQNSPAAVERVAREKYNLAGDGETILKVPEPPDPRQRPEQRREKP